MNRMVLIAAGVLVVIAGAVVLLLPPTEKAETAKMGAALVPLADQMNIVEVTITQPEKEPLTMTKSDTGVWYMNVDELPVDPQRLQTLFRELGDAKIRSAMPETKDDNAEYGFEKASVITLKMAKAEKTTAIEIGSTRAGGGVFVRFDQGGPVYLVGRSVSVNADPQQWENKALARLPKEKVKSVSVTAPDGKELVAFSRASTDEDFVISGKNTEIVNQYELKNLAGIAENLSYSARLDRSNEDAIRALKSPYRVKLTTFDAGSLTILVGSVGSGDKARAFVEVEAEGNLEGVNPKLLQQLKENWRFEVPKYLVDRVKKSEQDYLSKKS